MLQRPTRPKTKQNTALLSTFFILFFMLFTAAAQAKAPPPGTSLAPMLEQVLPAVVNIASTTHTRVSRNPLLDDPFFRRFFDIPQQRQPRTKRSQSLGSGVIVDARNGYILTNNHVIDGADEVMVTLRDRRELEAKVVGSDPEADIALLKIDADNLTAVSLADSDDLRVGDFVVAIGNPFGLGQTVTYGIVSALGRSGLGIEGYENFIQTDASINPGNSGGALLTTEGELIGINTAIVGPNGGNIGIGFAIPSNMGKAIMDQLAEHGEVQRGQLGVLIQDLTPELAGAFGITGTGGAVVARVIPQSPAEEAGLQSGDIVTAVNGRPIADGSALRNAIGLLPIGSKVELELQRGGRDMQVTAIIGDPQETVGASGELSGRLAGVSLGEVGRSERRQIGGNGVEVLEVDRDSRAWEAGLRRGDIIVSVNQHPVGSVDEVAQAVKQAKDGSLLLHVLRDAGALFIVIR